jgi:hypothetical protein
VQYIDVEMVSFKSPHLQRGDGQKDTLCLGIEPSAAADRNDKRQCYQYTNKDA